MKRYEGSQIAVTAFKRGGYFILRVQNFKNCLVATKHSRNAHAESGWMPAQEKKFEQAEQANRYFKAIKRNNPDMKLVSDEPNKYISYTGEVKEY